MSISSQDVTTIYIYALNICLMLYQASMIIILFAQKISGYRSGNNKIYNLLLVAAFGILFIFVILILSRISEYLIFTAAMIGLACSYLVVAVTNVKKKKKKHELIIHNYNDFQG